MKEVDTEPDSSGDGDGHSMRSRESDESSKEVEHMQTRKQADGGGVAGNLKCLEEESHSTRSQGYIYVNDDNSDVVRFCGIENLIARGPKNMCVPITRRMGIYELDDVTRQRFNLGVLLAIAKGVRITIVVKVVIIEVVLVAAAAAAVVVVIVMMVVMEEKVRVVLIFQNVRKGKGI